MFASKIFKNKVGLLLISIILMGISALDGVATPYFLGEVTNRVNNSDFEQLPVTLLIWGISLTCILLAMTADKWIYGQLIKRANTELKTHVLEQAYSSGGMKKSATTFSTAILSDIREIENNYLLCIKGIIYCILQSLITLGFLLYMNWKAGLIFIVLGALPTLVPKLTTEWVQKSTVDWQDSNREYVNAMEDGLAARVVVKRHNIEDIIFKRTSKFLKHLEAMYLMMRMKQSLVSNLISLLYIWMLVLSFYFSIKLVMNGEVSAGLLLTTSMAADRVTTPLISIAQFYNQMLTVQPILNNLYTDDDTNESSQQLHYKNDALITLEKATIQVGQQTLIDNFDLTIHKGDKILIRGASGSGKSTLLKILLGEKSISSGDIYYHSLFGGDIYDNLCIIDQNPYVFNDTLEFNLTLGKQIHEQTLYDILRRVELPHLANKQALSEKIGKNGRVLSNGEMKRLELARALIESKRMILVDEVLSGLDNERAEQVQRVIFDNFETIIDVEHHIGQEAMTKYNKIVEI
ncbi:MAG: ABC transporter ATP-binding protein [Aerococcaceae bacterium]|nr:ABC transporter ATP-binding protein [Aerococcaceae bacterium]